MKLFDCVKKAKENLCELIGRDVDAGINMFMDVNEMIAYKAKFVDGHNIMIPSDLTVEDMKADDWYIYDYPQDIRRDRVEEEIQNLNRDELLDLIIDLREEKRKYEVLKKDIKKCNDKMLHEVLENLNKE